MSVVLLGLPLLIHTFFLYHREYRENVDDAFLTMRSLAESRALYIEQMIQYQQTILGDLEDDLPETGEAIKEFLQSEAKKFDLQSLFYAAFDEAQKSFCQEFLTLAGQKKFVLICPQASEKNQRLYVGRNTPKGALVIATPADQLMTRLAVQEYSPYPLRISLIDESGAIVLSSSKGCEGQKLSDESKITAWVSAHNQPNAWILKAPCGNLLAVKIPIDNTTYTLLLDTPEKAISNLQMKDYLIRVASLLFFICILGGGVLIWLTRRISKPLQSLCLVMKRIEEGGTHTRFKEDRMGFEINVLGRQMNQMLDTMFAHQLAAERERIARERLAEELKIGHQIQAGMLPTDLPNFAFLDVAPGYLAAREVSGDFYDMMVLDDGRLLIAMGDAADKGISACLYSLSFRSMLRMAAAVEKDLARIVTVSNSILMRDTAATSFFITAWIGLYDPQSKELTYCSQGHPPAYVRTKAGQVIELSAEGMALGLEKLEPRIAKFALSEQDLLFLYTDGVIEAIDADQQFFGKERLKEFLARCKKSQPQAFVDQLIDEIHLFSRGAAQSDDLTILAIRVKQ
ncbi:MAG: hypothetical protein HW387_1523 [Parachlamydiales bacterium]|nr:hypothetical protein [Parachlamydiales bacterium]